MRHFVGRIVGTVPNARWLAAGITGVTIACAFLAHLVAKEDFPTIGESLWWSVQTVTTVGYGDVTPKTLSGRLVAAVLMVSAIALISVLTAAISAGFVNRMQAKRGNSANARIMEALERIERRLDALDGGEPAARAGGEETLAESSPG
jgi:voltage-gated potassium channel Kch